MAKEQPKKNLEPKKPKFSAYWIYGGIIIIFLAINIFSGSGFNEPTKTNPTEFLNFLREGDVEKLVIVNRSEGRVFLTEEAKAKDIHKKTGENELFPSPDTPDYTFKFGDLQNLEDKISEVKDESNIDAPVELSLIHI